MSNTFGYVNKKVQLFIHIYYMLYLQVNIKKVFFMTLRTLLFTRQYLIFLAFHYNTEREQVIRTTQEAFGLKVDTHKLLL